MPARRTPPSADTPVAELWNLSDKTAGWLRHEGIETYEDLAQADLIALWASLKSHYPQVTRLMYYALWGARHNCHWREVPDEAKAELQEFIDAM